MRTMFKGRVVWITGASSGIGAALALKFAAAGAKLILSSRQEQALLDLRDKCLAHGSDMESILVLPLDITDQASLDDKFSTALSFAGRIDLLLNNAGVSQRSTLLTTDMATYRDLFEVNVFGQIALTKLVVPLMIEQGGGHIAVTASVAGKIGVPFRTGYCATKHAMMGFFDSLRSEVSHHNIKITTITPGYIRTNISQNALRGDGLAFGATDEAIAGGMEVSDCATVIMRGFYKGKPEIAVGKGREMHALWIKRLFPRLLFRLVAGQYQKVADTSQIKQS